MNQKSILFLSPYPQNKAPSQRLKYEQYFQIFEESGYHVTTISFIDDKFWAIIYQPGFSLQKIYYTLLGYFKRIKILFSVKNYTIVYVHLWVTPIGIPFFEWLVSLFSNKLIYDIDDMIFLGHSSEANRIWQGVKGRKKMLFLMRKANHVITCTPKLDEFVRQYNKNTTDISSTVDTNKKYIPDTKKANKQSITLGWSGSHSTSKYLYLLKDVFVELAKKYNYKLLVMGDSNFNIEGVNIKAIEWNDNIEIETIQKFDIGLYPLPDEDWVYGKSGLKAIQYMALGIPTIATAIGANFRIVEDGKNGFLIPPGNILLWTKRIEQLILDAKLRYTIGTAGRITVIEKYSVEANKEKYLRVFNSLLN